MVKRKLMEQPEEGQKSINLYCPKLRNGTRSITYCLYKCGRSTISKCTEYEKIYPELLTFEVEEKYKEKYGEITIPVPFKFRKRRMRKVKTTVDSVEEV